MFINNGICWGWFNDAFCEGMEANSNVYNEEDCDPIDIDDQLYDSDCCFCMM